MNQDVSQAGVAHFKLPCLFTGTEKKQRQKQKKENTFNDNFTLLITKLTNSGRGERRI